MKRRLPRLRHRQRAVGDAGERRRGCQAGGADERRDRVGWVATLLSRAYRAICEIKGDSARFVSIEEVSKHEY